MNRGNLFIISGPSGAGKGTICSRFSRDEDIYLSVSVTTRNKRNEETEGVTYFYDTVEGFLKRIEENKMLEWAKYGENYYGTPKDIVEEKLNSGINVILEIEVQGAFKVKEQMPEADMIFIVPPSMKELYTRLLERGRESKEEIDKRMDIAKGELKKAYLYNHIVVNDNLEDSVKRVREIINERKEKTELVSSLLKEIE